jgi:hypothetical protein
MGTALLSTSLERKSIVKYFEKYKNQNNMLHKWEKYY